MRTSITRAATAWLFAALALAATHASAASLELAPGATHITFGLDSTLHYVTGIAQLEEGSIRFDPEGGSASGRIVIDARSLDTGNGLRDGQMHDKVLESERFPRMEFRPETLTVRERDADRADVVLAGSLHIHGQERPLEIPATVSREGERLRIQGTFRIPYVAWGMRDMSNFLLSVDDVVEVDIDSLVDAGSLRSTIDAARAPAGIGGTGVTR